MKRIYFLISFILSFTVLSASAGYFERVAKYCYDNGSTNVDYNNQTYFRLQDDGAGPFISSWNIIGLAQPTTNDLSSDGVATVWYSEWFESNDTRTTVFDTPIETDTLILKSITNNYGIGLVADDNQDLVTFVYHASPINPAMVASNKAAALALRKQNRQDLRTVKTNIVANIDAINTSIDNCTTNIADMTATTALTNGFTAAENRTLLNTVRKETKDADIEMKAIAQEVKENSLIIQELRRVISDMQKDSN